MASLRPSAPNFSPSASSRASSFSPPASTPDPLEGFFPGQPKSLSSIALNAFGLGIVFCAGCLAMLLTPLWPIAFYFAALSLFHFLEFWTTAAANTRVVAVDSFLLVANWPMYPVAHAAAVVEYTFVRAFFPRRNWAPFDSGALLVAVGLVLVLVGQIVRSAAMLTAGASFNHKVQSRKADSHKLVTTGIYSILRHPSYFGFFYWALGTQLVLGNIVCFVAFSAVLWLFFSRRIKHEETKLVDFFGRDYVEYSKRVFIWLPFMPKFRVRV